MYQLKDNRVWVQKMKLSVLEDQYLGINMRLGSSMALSGDMALIGYGEVGEIFSYAKNCYYSCDSLG